MMRCSLARLAYELCAWAAALQCRCSNFSNVPASLGAQGWLGATLAGPAPQGPKGVLAAAVAVGAEATWAVCRGARIAGYLVMFSIILRNRGGLLLVFETSPSS